MSIRSGVRRADELLLSALSYRTSLLSLRENVVALQSALGSAGDPIGLSSVANVAYVDFSNAPLKVAGVSINETDDDTLPVRGGAATLSRPGHGSETRPTTRLQITGSDEDFGSTPILGPLLPDGSSVLLAAHAQVTLIQGLWALYSSASTVALGVRLNSSDPAPASCSPQAAGGWNFIVNTMGGVQVRLGRVVSPLRYERLFSPPSVR